MLNAQHTVLELSSLSVPNLINFELRVQVRAFKGNDNILHIFLSKITQLKQNDLFLKDWVLKIEFMHEWATKS